MNQNKKLLQIIRSECDKKGRPLKLITDWDEVLKPLNPFFFYKLAKEKGWKLPTPKETFEEWFEYYIDNAKVRYKNKVPITMYVGIEKIEQIRNEDPDWLGKKGIFNEIVRKPAYKIMKDLNFYEEAPFLSIAEELLMSMREGLISEFVVISSTVGKDMRKKSYFKKTFDKIPLKKHLEINEWGHFTRTGKKRADWIKENHPDFDIFIDDNPAIIEEVMEVFTNSPEKIYFLPDYKCKRHIGDPKGPNVHRIKTTASDLKVEDFAIAALEMKVKDLEKQLKAASEPKTAEREREREQVSLWKQPHIYLAFASGAGIVVLLGLGIYWLFSRKSKK